MGTQPNKKKDEVLRRVNGFPALEAFVSQIARMTQDGEIRAGETEEYVMENDDAVATLNTLIEEARKLLGA